MNTRWRVSLFINVARTESDHTDNNSKLNSTKKLCIEQKYQNNTQNTSITPTYLYLVYNFRTLLYVNSLIYHWLLLARSFEVLTTTTERLNTQNITRSYIITTKTQPSRLVVEGGIALLMDLSDKGLSTHYHAEDLTRSLRQQLPRR